MMKKIKWEHILLFFLELLVNMATVGVAILLNALIDAAQISITSGNTYYLQKTLLISILYAVCLGILIFLSNRYKAYYIKKYLLDIRNSLAKVLYKPVSLIMKKQEMHPMLPHLTKIFLSLKKKCCKTVFPS